MIKTTLSLMLLTRNGARRVERLMANMRGRVDEVVIGVDAASTDDTLAIARRHASTVVVIENEQRIIEPHIRTLFAACTCDWVLRLDDDELMSTNFILDALSIPPTVDLVAFPRLWVVGTRPLRYTYEVERHPGEPNYQDIVVQYRLMRRDAPWSFVPTIHTPGFEMRSAQIEKRMFIFHMNLLDYTTEERQAKYDFYQSRRDAPWNRTYLIDPNGLCVTNQAVAAGEATFPPLELLSELPLT